MNTPILTILRKAIELREELERLDNELLSLLTDSLAGKSASSPKKVQSKEMPKVVKKGRKARVSLKSKPQLITSQEILEEDQTVKEQASPVNITPQITELAEPIFSADQVVI